MFYTGLIVGLAVGAVLCSVFYMWMLKYALTNREKAQDEFQDIQRKNGEHIGRIADILEKYVDA